MKQTAKAITPDRAAVLAKAVMKVASILDLKKGVLGKVLGLSPASVSRLYAGEYRFNEGSKEWELAALLVRLYRGLDAIMASDETALRAWLKNPNSDLEAVPIERITTITGLVDTLEHVDAYRARV
ncbi:MAG: antitoxin Xre-like helix-turn-helix domain-containing protein [Sulfuricaulis sp.]